LIEENYSELLKNSKGITAIERLQMSAMTTDFEIVGISRPWI